MEQLLEALIAACILIGSVFLLVGSFGLAKLPDTMRRLHAPTKSTTLGVGALLVASVLYFAGMHDSGGIHEILITLFLFLTAPVTANMIAKVHIFRHPDIEDGLPAATDGSPWATLGRTLERDEIAGDLTRPERDISPR